ncbi:MAG: YbjN domain-containing protein [Bacteroidales bacterium]|nr:YbjN domain-containing protein [Bacteroidales bacterium]
MGTTKKEVGAYLSSEGLRPQETDFGYVFEYQNLTFFIIWDDKDDQYLKIALPGIFNVDDNNRDDALVAVNEVNKEWKVIKSVVTDDEVWVVAEQFVDKDPKLSDLVPRTINILMGGRMSFYEYMQSL